MRFLILHPWLWTYPGRVVLGDWVAWSNLVVHVNFFVYSKLNKFCQEIILSWFCTCWYAKVSFFVWFNLNFTVVSNKWTLGKWKGNYFCVWNSLFMTAVITMPSVWALFKGVLLQTRREKLQVPKTTLFLGTRLWF